MQLTSLFNPPRFFRVTFAASLVLLLETVLFHIATYIHDFFGATTVVSYAVLGLGIGAFAAGHIRLKENTLFFIACIGTTVSIYVTSYILIRHPLLWTMAAGCALCIFFPTIYITVLFRNHPGGRVYLYDMCGAFLGTMMTVLLYLLMRSESIILLCTTVLPIIGLIGSWKEGSPRAKTVFVSIAGPIAVLGAVLFVLQLAQDTFNIFRLFDRNSPYESVKILKTVEPSRLAKSYDSLVCRIDIVRFADGTGYETCYDGYCNDHFKPIHFKEYDYYKERNITCPDGDLRVLNGVVKDPRIFIIGSAARGITTLVKKFTPAQNIIPVEIEPAIIQVMTKDFYEQSGRAYNGLKPIVGNAISVLKSNDKPFDIITLINTHSAPNIGIHAGPDYLHTTEHYNLYFDNLSEDGYLQFEERPGNMSGAKGVFRMVNTLWHTLKNRGVKDPSKHFMIYEWQGSKIYPNIVEGYRDDGTRRAGGAWYIGMAVFKNPLEGKRRERVLDWYHNCGGVGRIIYLKDHMELGEMSDTMAMVESGDFSKLKETGFDDSIITNDRPFPSFSTGEAPEIEELLKMCGIICGALFFIFAAGVFFKARARHAGQLILFNVLIGFGYFLIEIMLMQSYQNVFISPSWSLLLVLGLLLLSSGVGGSFSGRFPLYLVTALLVPVSIAAVYAPTLIAATGLPVWICKIIGVALIFCTGFLLGMFFPSGLVLADKLTMKHKIPYLFALNSIAGSYAVILALYSGVHFGYQTTILAAVILYCLAGILIDRKEGGA